MKADIDSDATLPFPSVLECFVRAVGLVECDPSGLAERRKSLVAQGRNATAQNVARSCDDQSALAVAAMNVAVRTFNPPDLSRWSLMAAPRYLGRSRVAAAIARFRDVGVRGMPPSLIPFQTSHAVSSTLSLYFGIQGPAFGVSIVEEHVSEGLLAAITWCQSDAVPGVWLVMTGWDPEPIPDDPADARFPTKGYAVAMALEKTAGIGASQLQYHQCANNPVEGFPVSIKCFVEQLVRSRNGALSVPMIGGGVVSWRQTPSTMRLAS